MIKLPFGRQNILLKKKKKKLNKLTEIVKGIVQSVFLRLLDNVPSDLENFFACFVNLAQ
jgi:hypothetical protein